MPPARSSDCPISPTCARLPRATFRRWPRDAVFLSLRHREARVKGMILCAGRGTRLRPLTERWPKAAIPVLGQPLLRYGVAALKRAGVSALGVNTHHLAEAMEAVASAECARAGLRLEVSREPTIQGTAGGIRGMRRFLQDDHFLVLNGDVLFPLELKVLAQSHRQSGALATMVLIPMPAGGRHGAGQAGGSSLGGRRARCRPGGAFLLPL